MIVSMPMDRPITYSISKVENTIPKGINMFTLYQDVFNEKLDYNDQENGIMYADYYQGVEPEEQDLYIGNLHDDIQNLNNPDIHMIIKSVSPRIKIGGSYRTLTAELINDADDSMINQYYMFEWSYSVDGVDVTDYIDFTRDDLNENQIKIKFLDKDESDSYIQKVLLVTCKCGNMISTIELKILAL